MKRIQGMSLLGMMFVTIGVIFMALLVMKIAPIYINHYQVKQSVNSLSDVSSERFTHSMAYNMHQIRKTLMNQLYINNIKSVKPKGIVIKPKSYKEFIVTINYDVKEKIFANIYILVHFDIEQEVEVNAP